MADVSSTRAPKRKLASSDGNPQSKPSKVTLLSPSLLLLEIPKDSNSSLPVWEAVRSQQVDVTWKVDPYSIVVHVTPTQENGTASRKSEDAAVTSSVVQQPQPAIQLITPQHGASQNAAGVLLTISPTSPPGQPWSLPSNYATSLFVSLPLIITQTRPVNQPSTPTKNAVLPSIQTPPKPQVASKKPAPSPFHTKSSSDVQICDNFLLGMCPAAERCKMHHTPYPFHWQLWCMTTHQWVNICPRSQVLLERLYCDVSHEVVCIRDGNAAYSLNFDLMELDDLSKYDGVRRLKNSDSQVKNPYFPSKWKIYWWNKYTWEEYSKSVSTLLLKKMSLKEPECSFHLGAREYKLDFTTMIQTNVTTGFQRRVRCRPEYRSLDSLLPYLQTGVTFDSYEPPSDPPRANFNVDPLDDFSSWYPPVWCLSLGEDYSLVDVPAGTKAYQKVQDFFYKSMPETRVDIISIQQIQNLLHWDKYQRHKAYMQKQQVESKETLERHLFHGTTKEASAEICHNNFDPRVAGINGTSYGFGSYFATSATLSNSYSTKVGPDEARHMFLAKVLVGKVNVGRKTYRRPPPLDSRKDYRLYDTCVNQMDKPTMFVVFDSCQCYPYYLIKYKDLPKEIEIC